MNLICRRSLLENRCNPHVARPIKKLNKKFQQKSSHIAKNKQELKFTNAFLVPFSGPPLNPSLKL
jgi:hypothetical protein